MMIENVWWRITFDWVLNQELNQYQELYEWIIKNNQFDCKQFI